MVIPPGRVAQVVVVPRNGYANRLQAWASASVLADALGAPLQVLWEEQAVATTPPSALFSSSLLAESFVDASHVTALVGDPHDSVPRYLTSMADGDVIVLAGHDRGEQVFMAELAGLLSAASNPVTLVIIAGGLFHLPGASDPEADRRDFYRRICWSSRLEQALAAAVDGRGRFAALHVRETDRSREAPTRASIREGLSAMQDLVTERSLFICADNDVARVAWSDEAARLGFEPWSVSSVEFDRRSAENGVFALLDWRLLARATGVVHSAASTFSSEAVVAGGTSATSVALRAGAVIQSVRGLRDTVTSVVTYPTRRRST